MRLSVVSRSSVFLGLLLFGAVAALAHSRPKVMVPAAESTVSAPDQVSVVFTEALEAKFSSLKVTDEKSSPIGTVASTLDPADHTHMTLALPKLRPGIYTVHWIAAATDGHRSDGTYTFTVK